jgi:hypothetical protein
MTSTKIKKFNQKTLGLLISNGTEESTHLEFKRAESLEKNDNRKKEMAKDVSAFANSDGGTIIYGIEESKYKASGFSFIDGRIFTKEWVEQVLSTGIQRKIDGLKIYPVRIDGEIEKTIYIINIPASSLAPHMTLSKKFYRRYNFESVEMEEYEIRNLYLRRNPTKLLLEKKLTESYQSHSRDGKPISYGLKYRFNIKNIGNSIEMIFKLVLKYPKDTMFTINGDQRYIYTEINEGNCNIYSLSNENPIFQYEELTFCSLEIHVTKINYDLINSQPITAKLYFSAGVEELEISPLLDFKYNGAKMQIHDFFSL